MIRVYPAGYVFLDLAGTAPAASGTLYIYENGTTTLETIYSDTMGTLSGNPLTLGADGRLPNDVYVNTVCRVRLREYHATPASGTLVFTKDDQPSIPAASDILYEGGSVDRTVESKLSDFLHFKDYGAVGNGVTDDTTAIDAGIAAAAALRSPIYGSGYSYAVSGNIDLLDYSWIENTKFVQLTPDVVVRTLAADGVDHIKLRNVTVDRNGDPDSLTVSDDYGDACAIWISDCTDVVLEDVEVYGDSMGNGINLTGSSNFRLVRPYVHDMRWSKATAPDPAAELVQGVWLNACSDFDVIDARIINLDSQIGADPVRAFQTRGIVLSGCTLGRISGGSMQNVGQGFDATGSDPTTMISITGMQAIDCDSFGFKVASTTSNEIGFTGCTARTCGFSGFVLSGTATNITLIGCKAVSTGSNGEWSGSSVAGFATLGSAAANIRYIECEAIDEQDTETMKYGFRNEVAPAVGNSRSSRMIGCRVVGATISDTFQYIGDYGARVRRVASQTIANDTVTVIAMDTETSDPYAIHAAGVVTVREPGLYQVNATMNITANATGYRSLVLYISGSPTEVLDSMPGNATVNVLKLSAMYDVAKDQSIDVRAYQNSTGNLDVTSARLDVLKVYGAVG